MVFRKMGFSYTIKEKRKETFVWRCCVRVEGVPYSATVRQTGSDFRPGMRQHNHQPRPEAEFPALIAAEAKEDGANQPFTPASQLVGSAMAHYLPAGYVCPSLPSCIETTTIGGPSNPQKDSS